MTVAVRSGVCPICNPLEFPVDFFADDPVSEGHFDVMFRGLLDVNMRIDSVLCDNLELIDNGVMALNANEDGWVACLYGGPGDSLSEIVCMKHHEPEYLYVIYRGAVSVHFSS